MTNPTVLLVEDNPAERDSMARLLRLEQFEVRTAANAEHAVEHFVDQPVDAVISDLRMSPMNGLEFMEQWKRRSPRTPFFIITAYGDIESAVTAIKNGAEQYFTKPIESSKLARDLRSFFANRGLGKPVGDLAGARQGFEETIGCSPIMLELFERARRAAKTNCTVLIVGESGTGKELMARAIHHNSPRREGPYVSVNMAAIPNTLVESELFGHHRGAFTGAIDSRIGKFQAANGGTIFIDEIGDFEQSSQAKILRVLENRVVSPVGTNEEDAVDVRIVAATSRDIEHLVDQGKFREDLYYRLNVVALRLPPLRTRREDIDLLIDHYLEIFAKAYGRGPLRIEPSLRQFLRTWEWPGNIRQLRNTMESMVVMAKRDVLNADDLPRSLTDTLVEPKGHGPLVPVGMTLEDIERNAICRTIERYSGNRTKAAKALGISTRTIQRRLKEWNLDPRTEVDV